MNKKRFLLGAITATLIGSSCYAISMEAAPEMGLFKKKKKKTLLSLVTNLESVLLAGIVEEMT